MPQRKVTFCYGFQMVMTPAGLTQHTFSFTGTLDDEAHYEKLLSEWNKSPKGSLEINGTKEEVAAIPGALSAKTFVDLSQVKYFHTIEETNLDIVRSDSNIKDISNTKLRS